MRSSWLLIVSSIVVVIVLPMNFMVNLKAWVSTVFLPTASCLWRSNITCESRVPFVILRLTSGPSGGMSDRSGV